VTTVIDTTRKGGAGGKPAPSAPPSLYKKREPIYPKLVNGPFRRLKWALMAVMLGIYYGLPWVRWPRPIGAPQQAALVDFTHGRFYFFMLDLWPDEVYYITGLLVISALGLFLVTAWLGRLWCGYACPQTVWTDLFLYVERLFEGDRNQRIRLDQQPWNFNKIWRKAGKHGVWLAISGATGGAWIFYFHDAPSLWVPFWTAQAPMGSYVFFWMLTFTTYALAGSMREQVCTYMCPWPRIQGAMLDDHSLQVTYRYDRGETRGPHKKGDTWEGRGDCIDCKACVVVCPMGIDIRDGSQLECINCALCIDACDEIMEKVGRPTGLIAYDSDSAVKARSCGEQPGYNFIRPRTLYYGIALSVVSLIMIVGFSLRSPFQLHVARDRNPLFVKLHDGAIRNNFNVKLVNRTYEPKTFQVHLDGVPAPQYESPGLKADDKGLTVTVAPVSERVVLLFTTVKADNLATDGPAPGKLNPGLTPSKMRATVDGKTFTADTVFISEGNRP
jgi:cytochrome c oxidase accessory protein FixG